MSLIISSLYSAYSAYTANSDESPKKVKLLVQEMESRLNQLPKGKEKTELKSRIKAIKAASQTNEAYSHLKLSGIHTARSAGSFAGGPVGSTLVTYMTHSTEEKIKSEQSFVVKKGTVKAGSRRASPTPKQKMSSAVETAGFTALTGFASQVILGSSLVVRSINYGKSFLFS